MKRTISSLTKKLDKLFSLYIRQRDSDWRGYAKCYTCGTVKTTKEIQAGHYISRQHRAVRYDEQNVHAQCYACNVLRRGNTDEYALALIREYGEGILEELSQRKKGKAPTLLELEELIKKYGTS